MLGLLRSHALILQALHELGAGQELEAAAAAAPGPVRVRLESGVVPATRPATTHGKDISGTSLRGDPVQIAIVGASRPTLLAFLSSGCQVCQSFWAEIASGDADVPGGAELVVLTKGPEEESVSRVQQLAGDSVPVVLSSAAWADYAVPGSPYFVHLEDGIITGEGSSTTWAQVRNLMGQAVGDTAAARRAAGRTGPGLIGPDRDDPSTIDKELLAAGVHPGHESLYANPESAEVGPR